MKKEKLKKPEKKNPMEDNDGEPCSYNLGYNRAIDDYEAYLSTRANTLSVERLEEIIINWLDTEGDQHDSDELAKTIVQELNK